MTRRKTLAFENRAWEKAEHPRYVSKTLKTSKTEELSFEIAYHYVEQKYYVETYKTKIKSEGYKETYANFKLFDSLNKCFDYVEKTYNVKTVRKS